MTSWVPPNFLDLSVFIPVCKSNFSIFQHRPTLHLIILSPYLDVVQQTLTTFLQVKWKFVCTYESRDEFYRMFYWSGDGKTPPKRVETNIALLHLKHRDWIRMSFLWERRFVKVDPWSMKTDLRRSGNLRQLMVACCSHYWKWWGPAVGDCCISLIAYIHYACRYDFRYFIHNTIIC